MSGLCACWLGMWKAPGPGCPLLAQSHGPSCHSQRCLSVALRAGNLAPAAATLRGARVCERRGLAGSYHQATGCCPQTQGQGSFLPSSAPPTRGVSSCTRSYRMLCDVASWAFGRRQVAGLVISAFQPPKLGLSRLFFTRDPASGTQVQEGNRASRHQVARTPQQALGDYKNTLLFQTL